MERREDRIYRAERLLQKRTVGKNTEYLVKWSSTWEPESHILNKRLITAFEKRQKGAKNEKAVENGKAIKNEKAIQNGKVAENEKVVKTVKKVKIEEGIYAAERLVQRRKIGGTVEYLIKWRGWNEVYNTWEPESHILDKRLIVEFEKQQNGQKKETENGQKKKTENGGDQIYDDQIYAAEKLLQHRKIGRTVEYLVKWVGWHEKDSTWEPESHILDKTLIHKYNLSRMLKRNGDIS